LLAQFAIAQSAFGVPQSSFDNNRGNQNMPIFTP